jgi:hypothetical protein
VTRDARPYLVASPSRVEFGPWQRFDGHDWVVLEEAIDGWDSESDVVVRRSVVADWETLRGDVGLPSGFPLKLSCAWRSSSSQARETICCVVIGSDGAVSLEGVLVGARAGGTLTLTTSLTTADDWLTAPPAVARWAGSVLVEDSARVSLEGDGSQFPVAVVDFAHTPHHLESSWHLSWTGELAAPFLGSMLLSINSRDAELVGALSETRPDAFQRSLLDALHHEVAMMMLELAVEAEAHDDLLDVTWPAESGGEVLQNLRRAAGAEAAPTDPCERRTWLAGVTRAGNGRTFL